MGLILITATLLLAMPAQAKKGKAKKDPNGLVLDVPFEVLFDVFTNGTNGPQWYESAVSTCSENDENRKGGKGESFNFFNDHWIDGWAFEEYDNCLADYEPGVGSIEPRCLNEYEEEEQENIENATALEAKWRCATDTIFNSPVLANFVKDNLLGSLDL